MDSKKRKIISIFILSIILWALSSELNRAWADLKKVWLPSEIVLLEWKDKGAKKDNTLYTDNQEEGYYK